MHNFTMLAAAPVAGSLGGILGPRQRRRRVHFFRSVKSKPQRKKPEKGENSARVICISFSLACGLNGGESERAYFECPLARDAAPFSRQAAGIMQAG